MTTPSRRALLGCIADDFTGATDLANMLVRGGMRTVQTIGVPASNDAVQADALVVALKSRTIPAADAVAQSLAALDWLRAQGCRQFFFKYCSTFDSTDAGNIGPVTDALLDALSAEVGATAFTIACPAFPENGRTIYRGYLFVGDTLLNESGMENHPLTPMRDANLVRVLQRQTGSKVGLVRYDTVAKGVSSVRDSLDALRGDGVRIAIADAVSDADLYVLGEACADLTLITGGSGVALGLPANFRRAGLLAEGNDAAQLPRVEGLSAVLAGSASKATNAQVAVWRETRPAFRIDPLAAARGEPVIEQALAFAQPYLDKAEPVLIYATATPDEVKAVQRELGVNEAGHLVESTLASIARGLHERGVRKFVVAGGETSGAVVQALDVRTLRIGAQIDPGVPATATTDADPLALALKSGNFGTTDFFDKALRHLDGGVQ
ncbi:MULTISPECIES: 3-oxo-tetronate kinase [Paraburkholderia]|jgi:3-dehydrotetronate 4-kinase|uniref:3-oxo-tetronate kinase n=1 Tax=Paraburkholderia aspalathi TaxID=1324617 RepID=A0A1I7CPD2_9BURK|nr:MULTISPECIES: 3-oxo-tetronate kinase [Paraburkholderia]MCX4141863.1 four-carbon acid sugar kinase family protein [Paraburkholderia aspalathi]MCX4159158.1 four-carbon acid sugar kinase family protein [Paraburkholderia aspalathi]MDN7168557.1 four-carbon acid sugar kinase family protein [Paraburkholderia sp. SECH2]MDN7174543.1 four-carbon acid sugar kinase family protein [Paraburkholderia sp. SEWSISQ10-3 4]MDQ6397044.1 four-carbon acid sugar kinase family protein [Paraburkholderia aspalathi]